MNSRHCPCTAGARDSSVTWRAHPLVASETGDEKSHWVSVEKWGGHQASSVAATSSSLLLLLPFRVACPKRPLKEMANLEG